MPQIDYPATLTQKDWDKRKPLIAKTKATGIGALLKQLEKLHNDVPWSTFNFKNTGMIASLDGRYEDAVKAFSSKEKAIVSKAKEVSDLSTKWAADYTKDKLIPKSAAQACKAIADAAKDYAKDIAAFDGTLEDDYKSERKILENAVRGALKPMLTKSIQKVDLFLNDINKLKSAPTKDNLLSLATGDGGARGYCTACKNWDQILSKSFPDIAGDIYKGSAMKDFFPAAQEYGANHSSGDWEKMLEKLMKAKGVDEDGAVEFHATYLSKQVSDIKTFKGYLAAAIDAIN